MTYKEIIRALRCCADGECKDCAMHEDKQRCQENLLDKAADLIERLTAENAKAEAERDALIEQIKARRSCLECKHFDYCEFDDATVMDCMNCVTKNFPCYQCGNSSRWEWRGLPGAIEGGKT